MSKIKISKEQAYKEVIEFLELHCVDTDVEDMLEDDAKEFDSIVKSIAKPITTGRAIIDGDDYVLTLIKPVGDVDKVKCTPPDAGAMFAMDKAKKGNEMAKVGQMIASVTNVPFAQVSKFKAQDFMVLSKLTNLFITV